MKALVYHGAGKRSWQEKPRPGVKESTDAVVRIVQTTICGTDLHILKGDLPEVTDGRILGHEGVGIVEEVGKSVVAFKKGDRVMCTTSPHVANASIAKRQCIRTAPTAAGFSVIESTARRPNTSESLTPTIASTPLPRTRTTRRSSS